MSMCNFTLILKISEDECLIVMGGLYGKILVYNQITQKEWEIYESEQGQCLKIEIIKDYLILFFKRGKILIYNLINKRVNNIQD